MKKLNVKWILTIGTTAFVLALALLGGSWKMGFAETTPTVPTIPTIPSGSYTPKLVMINHGRPTTFVLTITGSNFNPVGSIGVRYTLNATDLTVAATSVSADGTILTVTLPATDAGTMLVYVRNNPGALDEREVAGPLSITLIDHYSIYLPKIQK